MGCEELRWRGGAFAMSNRLENGVSAFQRALCGELRFREEVATGGGGTGEQRVDPLASQGALVTAGEGRFLLAVNAGDNTVSSFRLERGCLTLSGVVPSGGVRPVSIAVNQHLVYVVNAGGGGIAANLSGFLLDQSGALLPIPGSMKPLGPATILPSCAVFSPDGRFLVVSERGVSLLAAFRVMTGGSIGPIRRSPLQAAAGRSAWLSQSAASSWSRRWGPTRCPATAWKRMERCG